MNKSLPNGPIIDNWTYYDYKSTFDAPQTGMAPSWVSPDHRRRLMAYRMLESYYRNSARTWLDTTTVDQKDILNRREYGDSELITETALASLIGNDQSIIVPNSDTPDATQAMVDQFNILQLWAEDERFLQKVLELERTVIRLGDGCYVLGWDAAKGRPRLHVYDPGFYFPVLDESSLGEEEFPRKVHIAYEYEERISGTKTQKYLRRMTWELRPIDYHDEFGNPVPPDDPTMVLFENEAIDEFGMLTRLYPWNFIPTTESCFYTDATWLLGSSTGNTLVDDLDIEQAMIAADQVDLMLDFIPVVHIPCTVSLKEHFGTPVVARVMQLLDDIISTDTDLQASSAITGTPPIAVNGASLPKNEDGTVKSYGPGTLWETGDGNATMIDTSTSLDALLKYTDHLRQLLAVNSRTPESLLGRIKPSEVPSGIALTLSFAPHTALINEMRLVRKDKYATLLKFVCRMFMASGDLLEIFPAELAFGSFLPADRQETSTLVQQLFTAKAISLETAIRMLVEAGFPIEDALAEVQLIQSRNFTDANALLDASGDVAVVRDYLGLGPIAPLDLAALEAATAGLPAAPEEGGAPVA